jgi:hypothetical protein
MNPMQISDVMPAIPGGFAHLHEQLSSSDDFGWFIQAMRREFKALC